MNQLPIAPPNCRGNVKNSGFSKQKCCWWQTEIRRKNQLKLGTKVPIIYRVLFTSQVVQDFFHLWYQWRFWQLFRVFHLPYTSEKLRRFTCFRMKKVPWKRKELQTTNFWGVSLNVGQFPFKSCQIDIIFQGPPTNLQHREASRTKQDQLKSRITGGHTYASLDSQLPLYICLETNMQPQELLVCNKIFLFPGDFQSAWFQPAFVPLTQHAASDWSKVGRSVFFETKAQRLAKGRYNSWGQKTRDVENQEKRDKVV